MCFVKLRCICPLWGRLLFAKGGRATFLMDEGRQRFTCVCFVNKRIEGVRNQQTEMVPDVMPCPERAQHTNFFVTLYMTMVKIAYCPVILVCKGGQCVCLWGYIKMKLSFHYICVLNENQLGNVQLDKAAHFNSALNLETCIWLDATSRHLKSAILQYSFIICVELVVKKIVAAAKEKEALQSEKLS